MDSEEESVKERLVYEYNLVHSIIPDFKEKFKQQLVSKLIGKFLDGCSNSRIELPNSLDTNVEVLNKRDGEKNRAVVEAKNGDEFNLNWCYSCRNLLIPGISLRVRIKYEKVKERGEKGEKGEKVRKVRKVRKEGADRWVEYECLQCSTRMRFLDSLVRRDSKKEERINNKIIQDTKDKIRANALNMEEIRSRKRKLDGDNKNDGRDTIANKPQKGTQARKKNKKKRSELSGLLEKKRQEEANQEGGMSLFDFMK